MNRTIRKIKSMLKNSRIKKQSKGLEDALNRQFESKRCITFRYTTENENVDFSSAHPGDAGLDLCAIENVKIPPHQTVLVRTGLKMAIPSGFFGMVCSRSGLALKYGVFVANSPGIVDSGYRGDVGVILYNSSDIDYQVIEGDRVAQLIISECIYATPIKTYQLDETSRNAGGFGSSGR